jgi:hypothetical protein
MRTIEQVDSLIAQLEAEGTPKPDSIRQIALACLDWPYVYGAWGEQCTPSGRKRRARSEHPTIVSKCPALSRGAACNEQNCKWGVGVRMYDCRGFTAWLLKQVGISISGEGATSQYNTAANWMRRGSVNDMPDCVCCLFRKKENKMEHTGMHIGGGIVVDCSGNVRTGGMSGWTHYAIPVGLYKEGEIPMDKVKPTLRKGAEGESVKELQTRLNDIGYDCGTVDGKFGNKTLAAVKEFQRKHGLTDDGVVGRQTWAELLKSTEEKEPTYKVICYGMTFEQLQKIREICPTAEVHKE